MSYSGNLIPAMTSATAPSGIASSSGNYNSTYPEWNAFNGAVSGDNLWLANTVNAGSVQYRFPLAHVVTQYAITSSAYNPTHAPKNWTFKGSNDGSTWDTLDTHTNVTDWASSQVRHVYSFTNSTAYLYYRLDITATTDASYCAVAELEMMEAAFSPDPANIIPAMTSATAPSGVASSSGNWAGRPEWQAFDHTDGSTGWMAPAGTTGWLMYHFPSARTITQYAVTSRNEGVNSRVPKSWIFRGSNDGATWTLLDTQTNVTDWAAGANVRKVFGIANATPYAYYMLYISDSNDAGYVGVGELEMMEAVVAHTANLIPTMTSDTAPSGVASASGDYGAYAAWKAFDHLNTSTASWVTPDTTGWLQYQFPAAHIITQYAITSRNEGVGETVPTTWTFRGSNNGVAWTTLDTQADVTDWASSFNVRKAFAFTNTTAYAYYRLDITASYGGGYTGIGELEMMETVASTVPLAAIGNIALAGASGLTAVFAVVGMDASGGISLAGAADLAGFRAVVGMDADGGISLAGSASILGIGFTLLEADGTIGLGEEYADLTPWEPMVAIGTVSLDGAAWLSAVIHGDDTMQARGGITLRCGALRLSSTRPAPDPEGPPILDNPLPPTDDLGWTAPDVTIPDLRGLVVKVGGLSIHRAQITDLVIELDIEGGPLSATLSLNCELTRAPKLMQTLEVTYKGQTLFPKKGRLENISSNVDSSTGYTLTYAGPLVTLRDHKAFRCVYVDSDMQTWSTDQGPRTSPDTFEVASRSSGATV